MRSLRAPGRPIIARQLANSIEQELQVHLNPIPSTSTTRIPQKPSSTTVNPRRVPLASSQQASTSTSASSQSASSKSQPTVPLPFRPTLRKSRFQTEPQNHPVAGPSTSAAPRRSQPLPEYPNVYPTLPPPIPLPSNVIPTRPPKNTSTNGKGKGRAIDSNFFPPVPTHDFSASSDSFAQHAKDLTSASTTHSDHIPAARPVATVFPSPSFREPSPPPMDVDDIIPDSTSSTTPSRLSTPNTASEATPAPPGAFAFTKSRSSTSSLQAPPLRNPSLDRLAQEEPILPSPKQKALSAIQDLSKDFDLDFGLSIKKGKSKSGLGASVSAGSPGVKRKSRRVSEEDKSDADEPKKKKGRVADEDDEEEWVPPTEEEDDTKAQGRSRTKTVATRARRAGIISPPSPIKKRKASRLAADAAADTDEDDGTATATEKDPPAPAANSSASRRPSSMLASSTSSKAMKPPLRASRVAVRPSTIIYLESSGS
ncbi:hypothetical protein P7C70_g1645, partial [Phenoliferia sp. Uapishka_3]